MPERNAVMAVIYFLGAYALASLLIVGIIISGLILLHIEITATAVALVGTVSQPMSMAVGLIGGLLASTKSAPSEVN